VFKLFPVRGAVLTISFNGAYAQIPTYDSDETVSSDVERCLDIPEGVLKLTHTGIIYSSSLV
jgi:hypothetical protein